MATPIQPRPLLFTEVSLRKGAGLPLALQFLYSCQSFQVQSGSVGTDRQRFQRRLKRRQTDKMEDLKSDPI